MESGQSLKRRMKSIQNIGQITKAMELVSATKMRRSQELALNSRPYAYSALELLGILSNLKDIKMPPLLTEREVKRTAIMLVTSDKGLAGSFNASVLRKFEKDAKRLDITPDDATFVFIAIGQKAKQYLEHRGFRVIEAFSRVGDFTKIEEVNPITDLLIEGYLRGDFDKVISYSTNFITALRQEVLVRELLPINFEKVKKSVEQLVPEAGRFSKYLNVEQFEDEKEKEYLIEPSATEVLEQLSVQLLKITIYHMILEANASEHSARRVAMKNASDNAGELLQDLNIVYNKSRQAAITSQLIEVTSGAQALT